MTSARILVVGATLAAFTAAAGIAAASVRPPMTNAIPQPVYFWGSTAAVIAGPGQLSAPEVIRPPVIGMFADGSWAIIHLRWTGWGSSVAHATGTSSASNGIPNQAQGTRINRPATVALSHPGQFEGHEAYHCFTLTVPSYAASDLHLCLSRTGGYWALSPVTTPTQQTTCKNDGHTYIGGKAATAQGTRTTFSGTLLRFHPCGEGDGYFTGKTSLTLTLTPASIITVFKNELDPSATKTVTAAQFPAAFKKNKDESIYQYSGQTSAVKRLSEHFVS